MKIFISSDMEGTAGVAHWDETDPANAAYPRFARQMSLEVAAACQGAIDAGAEDVLVKDAHGGARNIDPALLPRQARIFRSWGSHPYLMMAGLDNSFDGVMFTGYHSAVSSEANPLSHTMNGQNHLVTINGELCSELLRNCLTAAYENVPVLRVTGDAGICEWARTKNPNIEIMPASVGVGNGSISIHPELSAERIRETAIRAASGDKLKCRFPMPDHFRAEICFRNHYKARAGGFYPGAIQTDSRAVAFEADDYMDVLKFFFWVL
jgi:D-amino peptidase